MCTVVWTIGVAAVRISWLIFSVIGLSLCEFYDILCRGHYKETLRLYVCLILTDT